jgi:hypothetical protein
MGAPFGGGAARTLQRLAAVVFFALLAFGALASADELQPWTSSGGAGEVRATTAGSPPSSVTCEVAYAAQVVRFVCGLDGTCSTTLAAQLFNQTGAID